MSYCPEDGKKMDKVSEQVAGKSSIGALSALYSGTTWTAPTRQRCRRLNKKRKGVR
jgi:hypothetical protein